MKMHVPDRLEPDPIRQTPIKALLHAHHPRDINTRPLFSCSRLSLSSSPRSLDMAAVYPPQMAPPGVVYVQHQPQHHGQLLPGQTIQLKHHIVTVERYLSQGGFATVYLVRTPAPIHGTTQHVLKRIAVSDNVMLGEVQKEVDVMRLLRGHSNIVHLIDSATFALPDGRHEVYILMEFCQGGGIIDMMNRRLRERLTEPEILQIFVDVCEGVAYMHNHKPPLLHRDLKVENILQAGPMSFKLCDFGSSATAATRPPANTAEIRALEHDLNRHTTLQYRAPEMVDPYLRRPIDEKSDVWALGVLLYKLCYYTTPFEEHGPLAILNVSYKIPSYPVYSSRLIGLIVLTRHKTLFRCTHPISHQPRFCLPCFVFDHYFRLEVTLLTFFFDSFHISNVGSMLQESGKSRPSVFSLLETVHRMRGTTSQYTYGRHPQRHDLDIPMPRPVSTRYQTSVSRPSRSPALPPAPAPTPVGTPPLPRPKHGHHQSTSHQLRIVPPQIVVPPPGIQPPPPQIQLPYDNKYLTPSNQCVVVVQHLGEPPMKYYIPQQPNSAPLMSQPHNVKIVTSPPASYPSTPQQTSAPHYFPPPQSTSSTSSTSSSSGGQSQEERGKQRSRTMDHLGGRQGYSVPPMISESKRGQQGVPGAKLQKARPGPPSRSATLPAGLSTPPLTQGPPGGTQMYQMYPAPPQMHMGPAPIQVPVGGGLMGMRKMSWKRGG
ncbi:hypothetical protein FRC02_002951 [Tulasnella sp. 418]|nr:hypothetical protein FRC02_002951 [Tulasnella sp. 418]